MKFYLHPAVSNAGLSFALAATASPAWAQEGEEEGGVPHVLVEAANGSLTLDFMNATPASGIFGPGGEDLLTVFLPQAEGALATPPSPLSGSVFASNPISGDASGFINDDIGFEGEGLPDTADISVSLTSIDLAPDVDFVFLFGATVLSNVDLDLGGSGLSQVDVNSAVDLPGDFQFDFHPTYLLTSTRTDLSEIEGTFVFELADSGESALAPASFALQLTADTAAAIVVPEPATAGLLMLGGLSVLGRGRRRRA